ncbi:hypothetical protein [Actinoplanes couchii]|nr:hypothetical protein [Actinoplanes couchii]MDR6317377.1 hypothetical protein [Actinoplanes couchii]
MHRHTWYTRSGHLTSEGRVRYEHCACGHWRIAVDRLVPAADV